MDGREAERPRVGAGKRLARAALHVGLVLILCTAACGAASVYERARRAHLASAAQRLGFFPSLSGAADYIEGTVEIGMTREQVEVILRDVAPDVEMAPTGTVIRREGETWYVEAIMVRFTSLPGFMLYSLDIIAYFDGAGRLTRMGDVYGEHIEFDE